MTVLTLLKISCTEAVSFLFTVLRCRIGFGITNYLVKL